MLNFSSIGSTLTFNPYGVISGITKASFSLVVMSSSNSNFQLVQITKSDALYSICGWYTISSSKFYFNQQGNFMVACWPQWVNYGLSSFNTVSFNSECSLGSNTDDISYNICPTLNNGAYFGITDFKFNVMVVSYPQLYPTVAMDKKVLHFPLTSAPSTGTTSNFDMLYDSFESVLDNYNCILGISYFHNHHLRDPDVYFTIQPNSIFLFSYGRYQSYSFFSLCMAGCPPKTIINATVDSYTCQSCPLGQERSSTTFQCITCSEYMQFCHTCDNETTCSSCYTGFIVAGGCMNTIGCTQVFQVDTVNGVRQACNKCNETEFKLTSQSLCQCKSGFKAGLHCTNQTGCLNTIEVDGKIQCDSCDVTKGFSLDLSTYTCRCYDGFVVANDICVDVCGNGKVFDQMCDDGNTESGDGCSSVCKVEKFYVCINGGPTSPSQCTYTGTVSVQLVGIRKVFTQNTGIFNYSVTPSIDSLFQGSYSSLFSFDCPNATFTVRSWTYTSGYLVMLVDYETDLEDSQAITRFIFNSSSISQPPIILNFTIKSLDQKLIYEDHQYVKVLQIVFKGLTFVALGIFVCGSWMRRMVGVELLNVLQLIFFLHFTEENYTSAFGSIQQMSLACLSPLFINKDWAGFNFFGEYQKVDYSYQQARIIIIIISLVLVCLSLFLLISYLISQKILENQDKILGIIKNVYDHILFPVTYFVFLPFFYLILGNSNRSNLEDSPEKMALLKLLSFSVLGLVFGKELKNIFVLDKNRDILKKSKLFYIPIYSFYIFSQLIFLFLWLKLGIYFCCYPLISVSFLMLIWQILYRPYHGVVDNISIIFNMALATGFQGFLILREKEYFAENQNIDDYACFFIAGFVAICEILSIVRIIIGLVQKCEEQPVQMEKLLPDSKKNHNYDRFHDYREQAMLEIFKSNIKPAVPHFLMCMTCHQSDQKESFLGRQQYPSQVEQLDELKKTKSRLKKDLWAKRKKVGQQSHPDDHEEKQKSHP